MDNKLYRYMNWPEIEGIVYSECDRPHEFLGTHACEDGMLLQAFKPKAVSVWVKIKDKDNLIEMEKVDEAGYFALLLPIKKNFKYTLVIEDKNGRKTEISDAYSFKPMISENELKAFNAGTSIDAHKLLGAHCRIADGVNGTVFAVWAPNALRVSVVGDFNDWDGREYQMRRIGMTGVFEIFIPNLGVGDIYKFEIKCKGGLVMLKSDPYAYYGELRPATSSIIYDIDSYEWTDEEWMEKRRDAKVVIQERPISIYEMNIGMFCSPSEKRAYPSFGDVVPLLIEHIRNNGFTHVELMPVNEYIDDDSYGYHVTGFYSVTSRFGKPSDLMYFVNQMHLAGIGVIFQWNPSCFSKELSGLSAFDGSFLYECADPKENKHPDEGMRLFNYGRKEVVSYLTGSVLFMSEYFHADGIKMTDFAPMLYKDFGRKPGEWNANIYGGSENLQAIELIQNINSRFNKMKNRPMLIAEINSLWPMVTGNLKDGALGFDYKWSNGWASDYIEYMTKAPEQKKVFYNELTYSMIYAYSENFIIGISHNEVLKGQEPLIEMMPGKSYEEKYSALRAAYGYMYMHPGCKNLFMGLEFGQKKNMDNRHGIDWVGVTTDRECQSMQEYVADLNRLYTSEPALYEQDFVSEGFEWLINDMTEQGIIAFVRRDSRGGELMAVFNFMNEPVIKFSIGVIRPGRYKEIFNSDDVKYGGLGNVNSRIKISKKAECNGRTDSVTIKLPAMGMSLYRYVPE